MSGNIATKIKKYAAPNLPYAFIAWGFLKLGTAFRMAEGTNLWERLLDSVQHIAPAFSNIAPSLNPFDWWSRKGSPYRLPTAGLPNPLLEPYVPLSRYTALLLLHKTKLYFVNFFLLSFL